jgi:hypothetical protein
MPSGSLSVLPECWGLNAAARATRPLLRSGSNDGPVGDSRPCIGRRSCPRRQGSAPGGFCCRTTPATSWAPMSWLLSSTRDRAGLSRLRDSDVAKAIARRAPAGVEKRSSGPRQRHARDWAKAITGRGSTPVAAAPDRRPHTASGRLALAIATPIRFVDNRTFRRDGTAARTIGHRGHRVGGPRCLLSPRSERGSGSRRECRARSRAVAKWRRSSTPPTVGERQSERLLGTGFGRTERALGGAERVAALHQFGPRRRRGSRGRLCPGAGTGPRAARLLLCGLQDPGAWLALASEPHTAVRLLKGSGVWGVGWRRWGAVEWV